MRILFALFIVIPVLEMWLLITVGEQIGALATIGLVLLTAVIGVNLLRAQGFATLLRAQERLSTGSIPAQEIVEGMALAVGGALLLTPGFATDAFGFACLIPTSRKWIAARLVNFALTQGGLSGGPGGGAKTADSSGPVIIEGEYEAADDEPSTATTERPDPNKP